MEQEKLTEEVLEQKVRERVYAATEHRCRTIPPGNDLVELQLLPPYSILRSVERQEKLMHRMEKQQKVMQGLTVAIVVLTVAVVVLTVFTAFPSIVDKLTG